MIAEPFLGDSNFERSVVFMCEHNEQGTFGLVLNQTTNLSLNDVLREPVAVSYTHLDVYKRQVLDIGTSLLFRRRALARYKR